MACLNGFGRFGLNLFWWYFSDTNCQYKIKYVHDANLTAGEILEIIRSDKIVIGFQDFEISCSNNRIVFKGRNDFVEEVIVTTGPISEAEWVGKVDFILDCSGKLESRRTADELLTGNTKIVIISAITQATNCNLIMGFNHTSYHPQRHTIISFGSCTVNPGILILSIFCKRLTIMSSTINIIHSVPEWQLKKGLRNTLSRKYCTLEKLAPKLISSLKPKAVKVNYTFVPFSGVSIMDFEFCFREDISKKKIISLFLHGIATGNLNNYIAIEESDIGPETYLRSPYSLTVIKSSFDVRDNRLYFFGYFNNEGSGIRMHELASYIVQQHS